MPIVSEIMDLPSLILFDEVDIVQWARAYANFELLRRLAGLKSPFF
jgi:3-deoxy-D-arabino-heptulosonate 7-phosphate (DAHP) synthase